MADPDQVGAGLHQRLDQRLADGGFAVADQHLAEPGVAAHLAQHRVVGHVGGLRFGESDQHRLAGAVEPRADLDARGGIGHVAMQMQHQRGAGIQPYQAQAPGQALAEEEVVAVGQCGLAQQFACAALLAPLQLHRQAAVAGFARGVLDGAAVVALLQLEAAFRGGGRHAQRHPSALAGRQRRQPRAQQRVLAPGAHQRHGHSKPRMPIPLRQCAGGTRVLRPTSWAADFWPRAMTSSTPAKPVTSQRTANGACARGCHRRTAAGARWPPARTPRAVAGRGVRVRWRRPRSRYAGPVSAWSVRTRERARTEAGGPRCGLEDASPRRAPRWMPRMSSITHAPGSRPRCTGSGRR